jgi:hypothetical protein
LPAILSDLASFLSSIAGRWTTISAVIAFALARVFVLYRRTRARQATESARAEARRLGWD